MIIDAQNWTNTKPETFTVKTDELVKDCKSGAVSGLRFLMVKLCNDKNLIIAMKETKHGEDGDFGAKIDRELQVNGVTFLKLNEVTSLDKIKIKNIGLVPEFDGGELKSIKIHVDYDAIDLLHKDNVKQLSDDYAELTFRNDGKIRLFRDIIKEMENMGLFGDLIAGTKNIDESVGDYTDVEMNLVWANVLRKNLAGVKYDIPRPENAAQA